MGEGGERVIGVLTLHQHGTDREIDLDAGSSCPGSSPPRCSPTDRACRGGRGPWSERAEVHQATGMVVAQLGLPETDALALLRAHAYSHDQSVAETAHAVIDRRLAFSANPDQEIEST